MRLSILVLACLLLVAVAGCDSGTQSTRPLSPGQEQKAKEQSKKTAPTD